MYADSRTLHMNYTSWVQFLRCVWEGKPLFFQAEALLLADLQLVWVGGCGYAWGVLGGELGGGGVLHGRVGEVLFVEAVAGEDVGGVFDVGECGEG